MDELTDLDIPLDEDGDGYKQFASESFLDSLEDSQEEEIPNIKEEEEQNNDIIKDVKWSISLSEVPNAIRISEFGHTYIYGRLKDPDGSITNKFHGFFKNSNSDWKSLPGVLSERYTVVSLEKFIDTVIKSKFRNITESVIYNNESWKLAWIGLMNSPTYMINYLDNNTIKFIFEHIYKDSLYLIQTYTCISRLGLVITNTYNGTNKLKLTPIIKTTVKNNKNTFDFIDYFIFSNFTQVINHSSNQSNISDDLITIKENIDEHISILKNFRETRSIIEGIYNCFRKPNKTIFESILKENTSNNLLDVLLIASIVLYKKYSIVEHLAIRSKIESFLEREVF